MADREIRDGVAEITDVPAGSPRARADVMMAGVKGTASRSINTVVGNVRARLSYRLALGS